MISFKITRASTWAESSPYLSCLMLRPILSRFESYSISWLFSIAGQSSGTSISRTLFFVWGTSFEAVFGIFGTGATFVSSDAMFDLPGVQSSAIFGFYWPRVLEGEVIECQISAFFTGWACSSFCNKPWVLSLDLIKSICF